MSRDVVMLTLYSSVLKWARETRYGKNLAEPAKKLKVTSAEIEQWEKENPVISSTMLKRISKVYKRHVSVLLYQTPPKSQEAPKFRLLPDFNQLEFHKDTFMAFRLAQEIQSTTSFLLNEKENIFLSRITSKVANLDDLVNTICEYLNIDDKLRFNSRNSYEQLIKWKRVFHANGIIVMEHKFPKEDARAFTLFNKVAPAIVLNSSDSDNAKNFSLFHELAHLALKHSELDRDVDLGSKQLQSVEIYCNQVATRILVPENSLRLNAKEYQVFTDENVKTLADKFKVSKAVIWLRLRDYGLISKDEFNRIKKELRLFEPFVEPKKKNSTGGSKDTFLYTTMKRKSEFYISEVLDAFNSRRISYYDVVDYLGVKSESLPRLQQLMFR